MLCCIFFFHIFVGIMKEWEHRTLLLLGKGRIERLHNSHVLVVGLGGVVAYAAELIARAGVGKMTIIDADTVQPSNINRQLPALHSTVGLPKASLMVERLKEINPELQLLAYQEFLKDKRTVELLENNSFDFIVDAIDTVSPKVYLIYNAIVKGIKIISSMGAGAKVDPSKVCIDDISKSHTCGLAKAVRTRLKELGIKNGLPVVFSSEKPDKEAVIFAENEQNKLTTTGTVSYMPALFGCYLASYVVRNV